MYSRSLPFWLLFALASVSLGGLAFHLFPVAFPLVSLELSLDRAGALHATAELSEEKGWMPGPYRQAASFGSEHRVQAFVELEGGGPEAFRELLQSGPIAPYRWTVRLFQPGQALEAWVRFRPDGHPYGFTLELPEEEPGPALEADPARRLAELEAGDGWGIEISEWEPAETASELMPSGRVDHLFVYRHRQRELGEAEIRLRLRVGGDRVTELATFVQVPEAFDRRYEAMRSKNTAVAGAATFVVAVLYLLGGCLGGLYWLARHRAIAWRPALGWGVFIALLQVLAELNRWPLIWMDYDTAVSARSLVLWQLMGFFVQFVGLSFLLSVSFMAAEGLGRRAFPHHHQLWRSWSSGVANSPTVLGQTVSGYLLVTFFFAYEVLIYLVAHRHLGWWSPSDALLHPDVLATYVPWFTSLARSVQAGFWEECLFRAVPLAGAALLGQRFGRRKLWIGLALVLQALVFGAGHATYATQPAWARLLELAIPSVGFGLLYLRFGLLPAVILHTAYDVIWFALPLFVSQNPGVWDDRALVVLLTLLPLGLILGRRRQAGRWQELAPSARNRAWRPAPALEARPPDAPAPRPRLSARGHRTWLALGAAGIALWAFSFGPGSQVPPLSIERGTALRQAEAARQERGLELPGEGWKVLATPGGIGPWDSHIYCWRELGEPAFDALLGSYLPVPHWEVRWARFGGDVVESSEELLIQLGPDGAVHRVMHLLPEDRPGAALDEPAALALAATEIARHFELEPATLEEISTASHQQPARTDWELVWRDPHPEVGAAQARIVVQIGGGEVVDAYRTLHLPESWRRAERDRETLDTALQLFCWLSFSLIFLIALVHGILRWSRRALLVREIVAWAALLAALSTIEMINGWPAAEAGFSTAQPWAMQAAFYLGFGGLALLVTSGGLGLLASLLRSWWSEPGLSSSSRGFLGMAMGAVTTGSIGAIGSFLAPARPPWPSIAGAGSWLPTVAAATGPLLAFLQLGLLATFLILALDRWTAAGHRRRLAAFGLCLGAGLGLGGLIGSQGAVRWLVLGLLVGALLYFGHRLLFRFDLATVPIAVGTVVLLAVLEEAWYPSFPGARPGSLLGVAILLAAGWWWLRRGSTPASEDAAPGPPEGLG